MPESSVKYEIFKEICEEICQNKSFGFPLRMAVFCSIFSPSISQRKLWESNNRSSAGKFHLVYINIKTVYNGMKL